MVSPGPEHWSYRNPLPLASDVLPGLRGWPGVRLRPSWPSCGVTQECQFPERAFKDNKDRDIYTDIKTHSGDLITITVNQEVKKKELFFQTPNSIFVVRSQFFWLHLPSIVQVNAGGRWIFHFSRSWLIFIMLSVMWHSTHILFFSESLSLVWSSQWEYYLGRSGIFVSLSKSLVKVAVPFMKRTPPMCVWGVHDSLWSSLKKAWASPKAWAQRRICLCLLK